MTTEDPVIQFRVSHEVAIEITKLRVDQLYRIAWAGLGSMITIGTGILTVLIMKGGG